MPTPSTSDASNNNASNSSASSSRTSVVSCKSTTKRKRALEDEVLSEAVGILSNLKKHLVTQEHNTATRSEEIFGELVATKLKLINDRILKDQIEFKIMQLLYEALANN